LNENYIRQDKKHNQANHSLAGKQLQIRPSFCLIISEKLPDDMALFEHNIAQSEKNQQA